MFMSLPSQIGVLMQDNDPLTAGSSDNSSTHIGPVLQSAGLIRLQQIGLHCVRARGIVSNAVCACGCVKKEKEKMYLVWKGDFIPMPQVPAT